MRFFKRPCLSLPVAEPAANTHQPGRGRPPKTPNSSSTTPTPLEGTNLQTPPSANTRNGAQSNRHASQSNLRPGDHDGPPLPPLAAAVDRFFPRLNGPQTPHDRFVMRAVQVVVIGLLAAAYLSWVHGMWAPLWVWGACIGHAMWIYLAALVVAEFGYLGWWRGQEG